MTGKLRIIAGLYKGKTLPVLDVPALRPTPNRIRETVFNWLMHSIHDAICLDAFTGSGALGCEALSRGAKEVILIEKTPSLYTHLKKTLQIFENKGLTLLQDDAIHYLETTPKTFDIIFLDPPFHSSLLDACLHQLSTRTLLNPQGLIYIESDKPFTLAVTEWERVREKKAGQVYYGLFRKVHAS